jgi:hypothetical protein
LSKDDKAHGNADKRDSKKRTCGFPLFIIETCDYSGQHKQPFYKGQYAKYFYYSSEIKSHMIKTSVILSGPVGVPVVLRK